MDLGARAQHAFYRTQVQVGGIDRDAADPAALDQYEFAGSRQPEWGDHAIADLAVEKFGEYKNAAIVFILTGQGDVAIRQFRIGRMQVPARNFLDRRAPSAIAALPVRVGRRLSRRRAPVATSSVSKGRRCSSARRQG